MTTGAEIRLYSYKLKHDSGFAPNPFHGTCTLATCKPQIRESKRIGDWIAGFTSRFLTGDPVGSERLIYLMQVSEKLPLGDYYLDPRFNEKIPVLHSDHCIRVVGDNIYRWQNGDLVQIPNRSHTPEEAAKDIRGQFALISSRFYFFGSEPLIIPGKLRPSVPQGQSGQGARTHDQGQTEAFLNHVTSGFSPGVHARPTDWRHGDESWREE